MVISCMSVVACATTPQQPQRTQTLNVKQTFNAPNYNPNVSPLFDPNYVQNYNKNTSNGGLFWNYTAATQGAFYAGSMKSQNKMIIGN